MPLVKTRADNTGTVQEPPHHAHDLGGLLAQLHHTDAAVRRRAARILCEHPEAVQALCERLGHETDLAVREAILDSLLKIGNERVVEGLIPLLRSDDAALRNAVREILQALPTVVAPYLQHLLEDPDPDIRIFAIYILQQAARPEVLPWLLGLIQRDTHVNVVAAAVDCLAEIGAPEVVPALQAVKERFADEPYIGFAVVAFSLALFHRGYQTFGSDDPDDLKATDQ